MTSITEIQTLNDYDNASKRFRLAYQNYKEYRDTVVLETKNMYDALLASGYKSTAAVFKIAEDHKDLKGFGKSTVYRNLPEEIKSNTKPKKNVLEEEIPKNTENGNLSEQQFNTEGMGVVITDDESSSSSESTTGPTGEEIEQEIEQPYTPPIDPTVEMITIPKVEHEEHLQTIRELSKPILASQYKTHTLSQTYAYHQQIPKILKTIKETGAELGLIFHWTSDGYLKECEPWNNGTTTTKSEDGEESD